jgi:hypothetical protein
MFLGPVANQGDTHAMKSSSFGASLLAAALLLSACGSSPTAPGDTRQNKTFSGVVVLGGDDHFSITTGGNGTLIATLTTTEAKAKPRLSITEQTQEGALVAQDSRAVSVQLSLDAKAMTYVLHVETFGDSVPMPYTLTVVYP